MTIDVGRIITSQIQFSLFNQNVGLYFPSLITSLCLQAGVEFHEGEELLTPVIYDTITINKTKTVGPPSVVSAGGTSSQARPRRPLSSYSLEERMSRLELNFQEHHLWSVNMAQYQHGYQQDFASHFGIDTSQLPQFPQPPHFGYPPPEGDGGEGPSS